MVNRVPASPPHPLALLRGGLAISAVLVFYTYLDTYAFALGGPKPWHVVLVFAAGAAAMLVIDPDHPLPALRSPLAMWVVLYFGATIAWVPSLRGYDEVWQVLYDRCRSLITVVSFMLVFGDPRGRRWAIHAVAACIVVASAVNVVEFMSLISFAAGPERTLGRSAGFYVNANGSALAIALGLALVAEELPKSWRVPLLLVTVVGIGTTFSRSGMLCLAMVVVWLLWRKALGTSSAVLGVLVGAWLLAFAVSFAAANALLNENTAARLHFASDDSGRIELALKAWNMFLTSPWFGHGLGATAIWDAEALPHNMYVNLAAEYGVLGLLLFPAFCAAVVASNRAATCFAAVLLVAGFFSHGLLDSRVTLLLSALAAAQAAAAPERARATGPESGAAAPVLVAKDREAPAR